MNNIDSSASSSNDGKDTTSISGQLNERYFQSNATNRHHMHRSGSNNKQDDDDSEVEVMINKSKCVKQYLFLEQCLGENNRNFAKCQEPIKLLKQCSTNDLK
jgi:hypothetical protein